MNKTTIFESSDRTATTQVTEMLDHLESTYLKEHKKKLPVDLFVSVSGPRNTPIVGITAYHEANQGKEVEYLLSLVEAQTAA